MKKSYFTPAERLLWGGSAAMIVLAFCLFDRESWLTLAATLAVTVVFYFILAALGTANLIPSTISVTTSCLAVLLTYKRSPFFAAAYAANDLVLIVLWGLAALEDLSYLSVFVCFAAFFVNDLYGFRSWTRMEKRQFANTSACARMVAAEQEDR